MPKLWNDTIDAHRRAVRDATLDAAAALVAEHGLLAVTMSRIAERTGIGRATLYKYFPDVETILRAWHERQIGAHLAELVEARDGAVPRDRLAVVLELYAHLSHHNHAHPGVEFAVILDRTHQQARHRVHDLIRDLITEGATAGDLRDDVAPDELASYCVHAIAAASGLSSKAAVHRLVDVTLSGLRPGGQP